MAAIIPTLARHGHRQRALKSLICNIGKQTTTHNLQPCVVQRAAFTTTYRTKNEPTHRAPSYSAIDGSDRVAREEEGESKLEPREHFVPIDQAQTSPPESDSTSHVPWYLQVQQPTTPERPPSLSSQQKIPELPKDPPPLLSPLLEYVSVELGMDYLSLLDLRAIEPPPALGANLLMIVGTARSEKHLHVSADRLCRWLRTNYKLRPYADGLLGRNELKLKVRRRNKRTRMLSAVGASPTADTEVDEGIRTGWVCVNVGRVEGGDAARVAESEIQDEEVVGFGGQVGGSSIVVQLLTEDKRGEVDLEKLWTGILKRSLRGAEEADGQEEYDEAWPEEEGSERAILQHNDAMAPSEGPRATA